MVSQKTFAQQIFIIVQRASKSEVSLSKHLPLIEFTFLCLIYYKCTNKQVTMYYTLETLHILLTFSRGSDRVYVFPPSSAMSKTYLLSSVTSNVATSSLLVSPSAYSGSSSRDGRHSTTHSKARSAASRTTYRFYFGFRTLFYNQ